MTLVAGCGAGDGASGDVVGVGAGELGDGSAGMPDDDGVGAGGVGVFGDDGVPHRCNTGQPSKFKEKGAKLNERVQVVDS